MIRHEELHHLKRVLNRHRDALRAALIFFDAKVSDAIRRDFALEVGMDKVASKKAVCDFVHDVLQDEEE